MFAISYLTVMVLVLLLLSIVGPQKVKAVLLFGAVVYGVVGFMMTPRPGTYTDTVRFFGTLDAARKFVDGTDGAWSYLMDVNHYNSTPVIGIILYFIAHLSENGWLTFLAAFADIGAGFYLIYLSIKQENNKKILLIAVFYFLCLFNFNAGVSGVRCFMACSLAVCVAYRFSDVRCNFLSLLLYIPLILIHPFAAIVPIVYLLSFMFKQHNVIYVCCCVILLLQRYLQPFIFSIFDKLSFIPFFSSLSFKVTQYFGEDAYIVSATVFSRIRDILIFLFITLLIIIAISKHVVIHTHYLGLVILLVCFTIGSFNDEQMFSRSTMIILFASIPFACRLFQTYILKTRTIKNISIFIPIVLLGAFICLIDNLRAGVRFQLITLDWTPLIIFCIAIAYLAFALGRYETSQHDSEIVTHK